VVRRERFLRAVRSFWCPWAAMRIKGHTPRWVTVYSPSAELIAERANSRGTVTLVAPEVPFGGANYFGNIRTVLADIFAYLLRHRLTRLIVINGHDGNVPIIHEVALEIYREQKALIPSFYLSRIADSLLPVLLGRCSGLYYCFQPNVK
jgi:Creatinine amidohydrolase